MTGRITSIFLFGGSRAGVVKRNKQSVAISVWRRPVTPPLPAPLDTFQIYVSVGETLTSISMRTGVSLEAIIEANPQIEDPDLIFVGQIINVPLTPENLEA